MGSRRERRPDSVADEELRWLRRDLHRLAELSGNEENTAKRIGQFVGRFSPDRIIDGIGGHGLAVVYGGRRPGKTVMFRADLDALPIGETLLLDHGSKDPGAAHKCGHDGHMTMVAGLAMGLEREPPTAGRVVLLFQPSEETGAGAVRVLDDPAFSEIAPDLVFAAHNIPGYPLGSVISRRGRFASASRGIIVAYEGQTSHASQPRNGRSPALAMTHLIAAFAAAPQEQLDLHENAQVTVIHARLGGVAFGTSPGKAVVMATIRAVDDGVIDRLCAHCADLAKGIGKAHGLETGVTWTQEFASTVNHPLAVDLLEAAAAAQGLETVTPEHPFPWSEDFGRFTGRYAGALFGIGAGLDHPALHSPQYDFPDDLSAIGVSLFHRILREVQES